MNITKQYHSIISLCLEQHDSCKKSDQRGFEPLRPKASRFQVCPVNHSGTDPRIMTSCRLCIYKAINNGYISLNLPDMKVWTNDRNKILVSHDVSFCSLLRWSREVRSNASLTWCLKHELRTMTDGCGLCNTTTWPWYPTPTVMRRRLLPWRQLLRSHQV